MRILQHTNSNDDHYFDDDYYFFFSDADSDDEAIEQECIDYHSFGGDDEYLDNDELARKRMIMNMDQSED